MTRHDGPQRLLAIALAMLAGYVDAIGVIKLGGLFVSFMSGNTTRLAVSFDGDPSLAATAGGLILAFLAGVIGATTLAAWAGAQRQPLVLMLVAALLTIAAMLDARYPGALVPLAMATAMGAANCVFQRDGEVSIGVTYMTGTLVRLGQGLAGTLMGAGDLRWLWYLLLWLGLVAGAYLGARTYPEHGATGLLYAAGAALVLSLVARLLPAPDREIDRQPKRQ